jgi:3-hydroxyisobutyrate dehydrogenase-like beta-hydroxyacid dehydrogenase
LTTLHAGFIGLGRMGMPMSQRLLAAGHELTVWGRAPERLQPAIDAGARLASSPEALARDCDIVLLCVSDTDAVDEVVFGARGVAAGAANGALLVDHSSIHPLRTREMAERLAAETGMGWLDAPVSGGEDGAQAGALICMAGGAAAALDRARPLIEAYATRITHMGPVGAGQACKVCNQLIIGAEIAAIAEALNFAANFGVEASRLPDCLSGGWADSTVLQNHARRMAAAQWGITGSTRTMLKDMTIAANMGRATATPMPVTELVTALYEMVVNQGFEDAGQIGPMRLYRAGPV